MKKINWFENNWFKVLLTIAILIVTFSLFYSLVWTNATRIMIARENCLRKNADNHLMEFDKIKARYNYDIQINHCVERKKEEWLLLQKNDYDYLDAIYGTDVKTPVSQEKPYDV